MSQKSINQNSPNEIIYLDHHATTPMDPRVLSAMEPFWNWRFGNASSHQHAYGWDAKNAVEKARKNVAQLIHALPREIIFTSSATENINWISHCLREQLLQGQSVHAITSTTEHSATHRVFERLATWGANITWLSVDRQGRINPEDLQKALRPTTKLVSLIYGHNELGTLNDINAVAAAMDSHPAWLHLDASQCLTTVEVDVSRHRVDLLSISSHKMYGPKGIAALYVRSTPKRVTLEPLLVGGSQESGLRAGTVATPLVVGLGEAARLAVTEKGLWCETWAQMAGRFREALAPLGVQFNGLGPCPRLPQSVSVTFPQTVDRIFPHLTQVAVSSGSACGPQEGPSRALLAAGFSEIEALSTLRFCLGRSTTSEQLAQVTETLKRVIMLNAEF